MPTSKPRIQVTLEQSDYDILKEHCRLTNRSMASFVSEVVSVSSPNLKEINAILSLASEMSDGGMRLADDLLKGMEVDALQALSNSGMSVPPEPRNVPRVAPAAGNMRGSGEATPFPLTRGSVGSKLGDIPPKPVGNKRIFLASSNSKGGKE